MKPRIFLQVVEWHHLPTGKTGQSVYGETVRTHGRDNVPIAEAVRLWDRSLPDTWRYRLL